MLPDLLVRNATDGSSSEFLPILSFLQETLLSPSVK